MSKSLLRTLVSFTLMILPLAAVSAAATLDSTEAQVEAIPANSPWQVDFSDYECHLARSFSDGERDFILQFDPDTANRRFSLKLAAPGLPLTRRTLAGRVRLVPQGIEAETRSWIEQLPDRSGLALVLSSFPNEILARFDDEQIIEVSANGIDRLRFRLTDTAAAIETLRICMDDLLESWGVDVTAVSALGTLPQPIGDTTEWVTYSNYPVRALRTSLNGRVAYRLDVSAEGEVEDCTILVSSGWRLLDDRTCRRLRSRAHFEPATDSEGRPVPAPWINVVTYWLTR